MTEYKHALHPPSDRETPTEIYPLGKWNEYSPAGEMALSRSEGEETPVAEFGGVSLL